MKFSRALLIFIIKNFLIDILFILVITYLIHQNYVKKSTTKIEDRCIRINEKHNKYSDEYMDFEGFDNEKGTENEFIIPNVFHYLNMYNPEITYRQYLSILAVAYFQRPQAIYIHHDENIKLSGIYWMKLRSNKNINSLIKTNKISYKSNTIFEQNVKIKEHISDLLRLEILIHYGGIFLGSNILLYNSIDYFRTFEMNVFRMSDADNYINNSILISNRNSRFLKAYHDSYR
jgi:hypothetical protein